MVMVLWRAAPVLATTVKPRLPLPVLLAPDVMMIHDALLAPVHGQLLPLVPGLAVTPAVSEPPLPGKFSLIALSVKVQGGDAKHFKGTPLLLRPSLVTNIVE